MAAYVVLNIDVKNPEQHAGYVRDYWPGQE